MSLHWFAAWMGGVTATIVYQHYGWWWTAYAVAIPFVVIGYFTERRVERQHDKEKARAIAQSWGAGFRAGRQS